MTSRAAASAAALSAGALALAYLLPLRAYGLNVEDEGTLLYQIARVGRGELPYVDFSTGYTPGFFLVNAWLWRMAGDLPTLRALLAGVHAVTVGGLAFLAARLTRPLLGLALALLYLAFIPVFPGEFCAFNVPYPAWYATVGWLATAGAMLAFIGERRRGWLVVAGLAAAFTFAIKPNAGAFAIAGATTVLLSLEERHWRGGVLTAALWVALWIGVLGGVLVAFGATVQPSDLVVHGVPLVGALAALVTRARIRRAFLAGDAVALLAPFVAVSVPWLTFFWTALGSAGFLREVLLIGSDAAVLYYVPFPPLEPWAILVAVLAAGFAVAGRLALAGRVRASRAAGVLAGALAGALGAVGALGLMPEGLRWSIIWQLQSAAFALTLAAHGAGVVWLWRRRERPGNAVPAAVFLLALFMHLQLYPRADFMHLLMAAPLSLVFAGILLDRTLEWWRQGFARQDAPAGGRVMAGALLLVVAGAIAVAASPGVSALRAGSGDRLPFPMAAVGVESPRADDLRALGRAARSLGRHVAPGEPSLGFPAIDLLLLLTGTRNPGPHDYFFAGRPDHREEAEIVDRLAAAPPAALASLNRGFTFFDEAPAYYFLLRRFVRARYELAERQGRYDVLARRGTSAARQVSPGADPAGPEDPVADAGAGTRPPAAGLGDGPGGRSAVDRALARLIAAESLAERLAAVAGLASLPAEQTAGALLDAASGDEPVLRRAALATLLAALARAPEHGLETYVGVLDLDRRRQVLVLRTLRDLRDPRGASYLFAAAAGGDPRLVDDALGAMHVTRKQMVARRHLWAGPETPAVLPGHETLAAMVRGALAEPAADARRVAFAAELAGALGDRGSAPMLRARLRAVWVPAGEPARALAGSSAVDALAALPAGSPAVTAAAASALARLDPEHVACDLVRLLAAPASPLRELVPSVLLDLAERAEPLRAETRRCLLRAIEDAGPARAEAVWIAAALGDATFVPALGAALADGDTLVRRAAAWALGESPAPSVSAGVLEEAARADSDAIVRRLAAAALDKRAGRTPRALSATAGAG